jgi:hypothetical protein
MSKCDSHVYFTFIGDNFDPAEITTQLGIEPTEAWKKGDKRRSGTTNHTFSRWLWASERGAEPIFIDKLVNEVVIKLQDKVEIINTLKQRLDLESVLEIVLYVDTNDRHPTPALGHDLQTIEFLYRTQTTTDIDIYRYDSRRQKK